MSEQVHSKYIEALQTYIYESVPVGSILTSRTLKTILKTLPDNHEVLKLYNEYLNSCGQDSIEKFALNDYTKMSFHMKYLKGYYREIAYQKRVGTGHSAKYITVYSHRIKV